MLTVFVSWILGAGISDPFEKRHGGTWTPTSHLAWKERSTTYCLEYI